MEFDGGRRALPLPPRKEFQAQSDQRGVQGIADQREFRVRGGQGVEPPGPPHQHLGDLRQDAPVAVLVGIGQIGAGDPGAKARLISPAGPGIEADFQIAQTFPPGQMREAQRQKMIVSRKTAGAARGRKTFGTTGKLLRMQGGHDLGEDGAGGRHAPALQSQAAQIDHTPKNYQTTVQKGPDAAHPIS